jgi:hypothetical protein
MYKLEEFLDILGPIIDWKAVSRNKNVQPEEIVNHPKCEFQIIYNQNVTLEFVLSHPELPWDWAFLSERLEEIQIFPDLPWDYYWASFNPYCDYSFVMANLDKKWNYAILARRMPAEFIFKFPELSWISVINNPNLDFDYLLKISENKPDKYYYLSLCNVPISYLLANLDKPWNWNKLTKKIDIDIIMANVELKWDWSIISSKQLPIDFIRKYKHKLKFVQVSMNADPQDVIENRDLPWMYSWFSKNKKLSFKIVLENPDIPWNRLNFANNPFEGNNKEYKLKFVD